jgi:hypothetical protein
MQNKTLLQINNPNNDNNNEVIEFYNFHYSSMLTNLIDIFGNNYDNPIELPNDFDNKGISNENLKQLSDILKDFPILDTNLNNLKEPTDILDYNKRFQEKYYKPIPYLKLFDKLSYTNILSLLKLCNFLGIDLLIDFLTELLSVKIKNTIKKIQ